MSKLVLIVLAVVVLVWLLVGRRRRSAPPPQPQRAPAAASATGSEDMVACAHCGVHLPRSEALAARGLHYCSREHRDALPR